MAKIAAKPVLFKSPVSLGTDEYTAHLSRAEFVPTQPTASFTDLDGNAIGLDTRSALAGTPALHAQALEAFAR